MGLEKAIKHKKEHRKPYRGAKAIDATCRNHGSDNWSKNNRLIQSTREKLKAQSKISDAQSEEQSNREWMDSLNDDDYAHMLAGSFQVFLQVHRAFGTKEDEALPDYIEKIKQWLQAKHK